MNLKVIILILNALYIIATIIWAIIDKSFEPIVAIIGGLISFATYYVANNNSFSPFPDKEQTIINNPKTGDVKIEQQIQTETYTENNY